MPARLLLLLVYVALASGCYLSHERTSSPDASVPTDAARDASIADAVDGGFSLPDARIVASFCTTSPPLECGCGTRCAAVPFDAFSPPLDADEAAEVLRGQWQFCRNGVGFETSKGLVFDPDAGLAGPLSDPEGDDAPRWVWQLGLKDDVGGPIAVLSVDDRAIALRVRVSACERAVLVSDAATDAPLAVLVPVSSPPLASWGSF